MPASRPTDDAALAEFIWRGFEPRAALPMLVVAASASAALLAGRWYLDDLAAALVTYLLVLALWPTLLGLTLYRAITYTYRITDRALLVDRGFLNRPVAPIWLKDITDVRTGSNWLNRWLDVGWLTVQTAEGRRIKLRALRNPAAFAALLEERIGKLKSNASEAKTPP